MSKETAFERARKGANQTYKNTLIQIIKDTKQLKKNSIHVVYMDKNHPPNGGIESATKIIDDNMSLPGTKGVKYKKLFLCPEITKPCVDNYPFSFEFFA